MKIEIFGSGTPQCIQLTANVETALQELGLDTEIVKVMDMNQWIKHGVTMIPALAVDGKLVCAGMVVNPRDIKKILAGKENC